MRRKTAALCCIRCITSLNDASGGLVCPDCGQLYPELEGAFDFLGDPSPQVKRELQGIAVENGLDVAAGLDQVKAMRRKSETVAALLSRSRHSPVEFYQQTLSSYLEALARAQLDGDLVVLELGSDRNHPKLRLIKDLCSSAYALNIFFEVPQDAESQAFVTRVLADMSRRFPFADETLDLVVVSAALHHSPDAGATLREIARVLRRGGRAVIVNEPVEGIAKRLTHHANPDRNSLIKEDPISWGAWKAAIAGSGLSPEHFLPAWYLGRVRRGGLSAQTRFYKVAQTMGAITRAPALAEAVRLVGRVPGQTILGLPLNVVLWKR